MKGSLASGRKTSHFRLPGHPGGSPRGRYFSGSFWGWCGEEIQELFSLEKAKGMWQVWLCLLAGLVGIAGAADSRGYVYW